MADQDFLGEIFGDPADDPLLEGEELRGDGSEQAAEPSWTSEGKEADQDDHTDGADRAWEEHHSSNLREGSNHEGNVPSEKTVAVEVGAKDGLDEVNQSLRGEWYLAHVYLDEESRPAEKHASEADRSPGRVLMILRREEADSLFDFG